MEPAFDPADPEFDPDVATVREQLGRIAPVVLAAEQVLPVPEIFHPLLPGGGMQRGWTVQVCGGTTARAMAWALLGAVTTAGGWVAVINVPGLGLAAAHEVGVAIERVLVVTAPDADAWSSSVGALIGAVDVVVFGSPRHRVVPSEQRRMSSRARERGSVLVEIATAVPAHRVGQFHYDVSFDVSPIGWKGLGQGFGHLQGRAVEIEASGRRVGGAPRHGIYELPAVDGTLRRLDPQAPVLSVVGG